ncbi:reticuline oxidase-like protein [Senna tora]|uniref:Reticuline oxidase-like protein n=1 Tax=Senna tora TaxID=362788 RepID=A0A834W6U6_9FABA|nr:reticuline oxidase-like protein [Senna tora]
MRLRSRGHDYDNVLIPIILDILLFRPVLIDWEDETAWVDSRATIGEFGAGYGNLMRRFGLTVDHVMKSTIDWEGLF